MPTFLRLIEIRKREHAFEVMAIAISTRFILIFIKEGDAGRNFVSQKYLVRIKA